MRVIIIGGGGVGETTAKRLSDEGLNIVVIDHNPKVCERLVRAIPRGMILNGEATNPAILEEAGMRTADAVIAVTGEDNTNAMSAILAKTYGVKQIIVRIEDPTYVETCRMVGLTTIVNPAESAAIQIDSILKGISLIDVIGIARKDLEVTQMLVKEDSPYTNQRLGEIDLFQDKNVHPVLIIHENEMALPKPDVRLASGDKIILLKKKGFFETIF